MSFVTLNLHQRKKIVFEDMAKGWLLYKKCMVKKSTYYNYKYLVDQYLLCTIGQLSIDDFVNFNFNNLVENLMQKLSPKTIKDIVCVLKSILKFSEEKYRYKFYIEPIAIPKVLPKELQVLTRKEQLKLVDYCIKKGDNKYLGIVLSLYTGLRIGELCALKWEDIDLKAKQISIGKTLQRVYVEKNNTKILIDTPKSAKSSRKIPLNDKLASLLVPQKQKFSKEAYFLTGDRSLYRA